MPNAKRSAPVPLAVLVLTGLQILIMAFVFIAPFGFDKPSSWGLDIGHYLLALMAYPVLWLIAVVLACIQKRWGWALAQLLLLFVGVGLFFALEY